MIGPERLFIISHQIYTMLFIRYFAVYLLHNLIYTVKMEAKFAELFVRIVFGFAETNKYNLEQQLDTCTTTNNNGKYIQH